MKSKIVSKNAKAEVFRTQTSRMQTLFDAPLRDMRKNAG